MTTRRRLRIVTHPPPTHGSRAFENNSTRLKPVPFSLVVLDEAVGDMYFVNPQYIDWTGWVVDFGQPIHIRRERYVVHLPARIEKAVDTGSVKITFAGPQPTVQVDLDYDSNLDSVWEQVLVPHLPAAQVHVDPTPTQDMPRDIHGVPLHNVRFRSP